MGDFTGALRMNTIHDFKQRYREADLVLLDDVQFVEHKQRTAEEVFHTLDELVGAGAQVVVAADRPPSAMPSLEARLRDRLQSGLVVDVATPDLATRLSIVRKRAGRLASDREELAALESIAERVSSSVAALEGALIRVRAYASLTQQPLTKPLVERVLASLYNNTSGQQPSPATVEQIQKLTSGSLELSSEDLASPKRNRQVVYARQVAMYLCRELTSLSLPAIGQSFGGRDHTTVLHAHRQIRSRIMTDAHTRQLVDNLLQKLRSGDQDGALN
jgi:chromosomal replication initiator protein